MNIGIIGEGDGPTSIFVATEVDEKIRKAQEGIARLHKIDSMLRELESEQEKLVCKQSELQVIMEKEDHDVEKYEGMSLASIFYSILGSLEEHVQKERKEALAAKLKYNQAEKDLDYVKYQISNLASERLSYVDCQKEYDRFYAQKKEELIKGAGETAQKILEITDHLNLAGINLKEVKEAIFAGENVLDSLNRTLSSLDSAEGWGTWDLLGGGLISDLAKHSHIDDAKMEVQDTQRLLREFKTELTDISINSDIAIETEGFVKFADFFFDGLIADWFMQSRINESQESVSNVKSQVMNIIEKLEQMENQVNGKLEKLEAEVRALIINA